MKFVSSSREQGRWSRWAEGVGVSLAVALLSIVLTGCGEKETESAAKKPAIAEKAVMPDNLPSDVPVYPGFDPQVATTVGDGEFSLTGRVGDSLAKVKAYCETEASARGWTQTTSMDQDTMFLRVYEKPNRNLTLTGKKQGDETILSINVGKM